MNKYIMDTEFIRASKDRVHFIEVALYEAESKKIIDFHISARLNGWERRYISRVLDGNYGERAQKVFEAVDVLHSGKFNRRGVYNFCLSENIDYDYQKLSSVYDLEDKLANSILYAWDISNDKELFEIINVENYQLVDVQAMWRAKFGGNQLSLIDAYKHVLYNMKIEDTRNLIANAHFACCDVLLLTEVIKFIEEYDEQLVTIPIDKTVRDKKVVEVKNNIERWKQALVEINQSLESTTDNDQLIKLSQKQIRNKRKIAKGSKIIENLLEAEVYVNPWWE